MESTVTLQTVAVYATPSPGATACRALRADRRRPDASPSFQSDLRRAICRDFLHFYTSQSTISLFGVATAQSAANICKWFSGQRQ
ncbi:hypothetical protein SKAU_G00106300 [Synaphobranchus kaupii]|uniref:Uncharacterized protein n=1 Tax=Synaphobranchus kaupii TaxID=118154 RepID=A0A9Q1FZT1_SYNKA|nr:hypothetical protein SKAU_G00106300 [Synaphobranchus kaupii]